MNNKEKPKFLYRGVKIDYELLKKFQFYGIDIKPPHEPIWIYVKFLDTFFRIKT